MAIRNPTELAAELPSGARLMGLDIGETSVGKYLVLRHGRPSPYVGIVPDRHGAGTNALVLNPPSAIVPAFGEGSCARHIELARDAGVPYGVEELASLGLDLDTPADVIALTRVLAAQRGRARRTARALGI